MTIGSSTKATLSGLLFVLALAASVGGAAAADGDGTGGGTGNGTGGGNRDGTGGGKKVGRQIVVGQTKKSDEVQTKVESGEQPLESIEVAPAAPAETTGTVSEVEIAPAQKKTVVVKKAAKKKVFVIETAPSEIPGYDSAAAYEQYEDGYYSYVPGQSYGYDGDGGCD
jgi:hypothetical protein